MSVGYEPYLGMVNLSTNMLIFLLLIFYLNLFALLSQIYWAVFLCFVKVGVNDVRASENAFGFFFFPSVCSGTV